MIRLPSFRTRFNLDTHEIVGVIEPAVACLVTCIEPARSDHSQEHVALVDLILEHAHEIETRRNAVNIHEEMVGVEIGFEPLTEPSREAGIVATPIIDKNPAGHGMNHR